MENKLVARYQLQISLTDLLSCLYFSISTISKFTQIIGIPRELVYGIYFGIYALFIVKHLKQIRLFDILFYLLAISISTYGLIQYGSYIGQRTNVLAVLVVFLPAYLFFRITDNDSIIKGLRFGIYIDTIYLIFYYLLEVLGSSRYNMEYAYEAALPLCFYIYLFVKEKKNYWIIISGVLFISILVSGNRGAAVFPIICGLYYYFSSKSFRKNQFKKTLIIMSIVVMIFLVILFQNDIFALLDKLMPNSRTISKLTSGSFFSSNTRDRLYKICDDLISSNKAGYGPLASRKLIQGFIYPHSLLYELELDFGVYIGIITFCLIILMAVTNLIRYRKEEIKVIIGIICILGIGRLMVSSSYYIEMYVPATIAFYVKYNYGRYSKYARLFC